MRTGLHPCLRHFPAAVLELDAAGTVTESNGRLEEAFGRSALGRPLADLLDAASREKLDRILADPMHGALPRRIELNLERGDRIETRIFYPSWAGDETGFRLWLVEHPTDVRLQELHDELNATNADLVNTQRELAKKAAQLSRAMNEIERKLTENETLASQLQLQNEEMEVQNEELLAMTEELHAGQEELMQVNHQLERRTRELQVALSARSRFYASMSHELRTPINAVLGYNDLLLSGIYGPLSERQEVAIERSQKAVRHLRELVDDVLDLSKIEAGKLDVELEAVRIRELVEDLAHTVRPMAQAKDSELHVVCESCPEQIVTDPRRVRQILLNLLSNAIKYGRGRPVWMRCRGSALGGVDVEVVDNGDGIAPEDLVTIFEEFVQLRGLGSDAPGTGLGLPVARRLAVLLGGTLNASSTVGVGSTFRLHLPPQAGPEAGSQPPKPR